MERINHADAAIRAIDKALAEQDAEFERLEAEAVARGLTDDEANKIYLDWLRHGRQVVRESDITIENSDVVVPDPNQETLWS